MLGEKGWWAGEHRPTSVGGGWGAMPPITIIFHHPNYIVECVSAAACAHPALLLLGKDRGRET